MPKQQPSDHQLPNFGQFLFTQRDGAAHDELTIALAELAQAVMDTDKSGSITLKITIKKAAKHGRQLVISDVVSMKKPEFDRDASIFFLDQESGGLSRRDPLQQELPLREVPRREDDELRTA